MNQNHPEDAGEKEHIPLRLSIDKFRLDEEWAEQANQYYYWAKQSADAQLAYDAAKSALDLRAAELDFDIRKDPKAYGIEKLNNDAVAAVVICQPEYKSAHKLINTRHRELLYCKAAVDGLEHRKRALTMLVELYTREYYADSHSKSVRKEMTEEERQDVRARGQRKMRQQEYESERES